MGRNPRGSADKRKKAIVAMLKNIKPNVVLLQEFGWVGIRDETWKGFDFPEYSFVGNKEACILYEKHLNFKVFNTIEITNLLKEIEKKGKTSASPFLKERICLGVVKVPMAHILCASWHAQNNSIPEREKKENLKILIECIKEIGNVLKMPFIIGGDFNLSHEKVVKIFSDQKPIVQICFNMPEKLRTAHLVDFFIASKTLNIDKVTTIKWEEVDEKSVENIFTHDSVVATLMKSASEPLPNLQ